MSSGLPAGSLTFIFCIQVFAYMAARSSQPERALRLAASAAVHGDAIGAVTAGDWTTALGAVLDQAREALGPEASEAAWLAGESIGPAEAAAYALDES